jgi:hypothetical protein
MCTTTAGTLTLAGMLHDPLIRLVMHSDGVSEQDHSDLLFRVKDTLVEREAVASAIPTAVGGPVVTSL